MALALIDVRFRGNSGHRTMSALPLKADTLLERVGMSALCQTLTFRGFAAINGKTETWPTDCPLANPLTPRNLTHPQCVRLG